MSSSSPSFFKDLLDSFFAADRPASPDAPSPESTSTSRAETVGAASVLSERAIHKLKGYFELAKEEIDKAVRCEEWGLADDAVNHYRNAQRVMIESKSTRVPDVVSFRDQQRIRGYQEKISKWQESVAERLRVLTERSGSAAKKIAPSYAASTVSSAKKATHNLLTNNTTPYHTANIKNNHQSAGNMKKDGSKHAQGNYDSQLVEMIDTTIVDRSPAVKWDDVAGLDMAKQTLLEMVILPTKRRDLFTGLRKPAKGLLLFGPPGNGKTMLAKAVASESEATFFNVSASSLTSKWVGEAEKLVRTLFMVAVERQPSIIFMDEIDSVLSKRLANENDASRRLKSEFLVQFDGVTSNQNDLVIVIGATNKPQELDDAVLRRLVKRIYVPLPDENVRRLLLRNQLKGQAFSLPSGDLERLVKLTDGYSGSDLQALCEEAAMMPIRELGPQNILNIKASQVRPLKFEDFYNAMKVIRPSLNRSKWEELEQWKKEFGSN